MEPMPLFEFLGKRISSWDLVEHFGYGKIE